MILFMYTCNTLIAWLLIKLETSNQCVKALNNYLTYKHTNSIYARQPLHHSPIIYQPAHLDSNTLYPIARENLLMSCSLYKALLLTD